MTDTLHLTVTTPGEILVDSGDVAAVRAEDESGGFGVLPGHVDLLTAMVPSVVRWRTSDGAVHFCAVRGGIFTVSSGCNVAVDCREAVLGDSLEDLEAKVRAVRAQQIEAVRKARVEQVRLHGSEPGSFSLLRCDRADEDAAHAA